MESRRQSIWKQYRDRRGGGRFRSQSWPDGTCSDACWLLSETGPASRRSEHKHAFKKKKKEWERARETHRLGLVCVEINGCQLNTQTTGDISESKAAVACANSGSGVPVIEVPSGAVSPATTAGTKCSLWAQDVTDWHLDDPPPKTRKQPCTGGAASSMLINWAIN